MRCGTGVRTITGSRRIAFWESFRREERIDRSLDGVAMGHRRLSIIDLSAAGGNRSSPGWPLLHGLQRRDLQLQRVAKELEALGYTFGRYGH
jgi:hypothetical protein